MPPNIYYVHETNVYRFLCLGTSQQQAVVSWAGAQTWLQPTGGRDTQGFDSSSAAFLFHGLAKKNFHKGKPIDKFEISVVVRRPRVLLTKEVYTS